MTNPVQERVIETMEDGLVRGASFYVADHVGVEKPTFSRTRHECGTCSGHKYVGHTMIDGSNPHEANEVECPDCDGKGSKWTDPMIVMARHRKTQDRDYQAARKRATSLNQSFFEYRFDEAVIRNRKELISAAFGASFNRIFGGAA